MPRSKLVIVANTLPVRRAAAGDRQWTMSPGGLVSALAPFAREQQGSWVGWTGEIDVARDPFTHDGIRNIPIAVSRQEHVNFYEGVCNSTLWPLYHDAVRPPEYHRHWWRAYTSLNRRFAEAAAEVAAPGAVVWVHDYHLQLVPSMLRTLRDDVRIGFFFHIPFPSEALYDRLPWRREVVEGVLGADTVGFQTRADRRNFARMAQRHAGAGFSGDAVSYRGRTVRTGVFPISIDAERFERAAGSDGVRARAAEFGRQLGGGRKMMLGVDRLDYTKGIDLRLKAFQQLLENRPDAIHEIVLVQVAVPSRERIDEYKEIRSHVEQLVGQINGRYGEVGIAVVHYLRRTLPFEELVAMYCAADIMAVTPLRDGMNLVSKEYVASRLDGSGVLLLSEFAGASAELRGAIRVNPYDVDGMAEAMGQALDMPPRDARRQMRGMQRVVKQFTVHTWAKAFLDDLTA
jgi:alpha,alpha-trehalose-phosphate synthase [UDP-forming]